MMKTKRFEMRMEPGLRDWLTQYSKSCGVKDATVVRELLLALKEGRIRIIERAGPSAFPGDEEALPGQTPHYPAKVATCRRENDED